MANNRNKPEQMGIKDFFMVLKEAASEFSQDKAPRLGAALSYYTAFSLAPMLVIVIAVAGLVLDPAEVRGQLMTQIQGLMGEQGAEFIATALEGASANRGAGILATVLSTATLLFGALGVFGQLQDALNTIWEVKPKPNQGIMGIIRTRLLSFSMVLVIAFLLLVSLALSAALVLIGNWMTEMLPVPPFALEALNFVVSFGVITLLFALLYKYVPDVEIGWRDVWIGAALTSLLFTIGKVLIGLYLGNASVTSAYGAAGSLVVLLLWVYYSSQILFFGAEFTQVYANRFGSRVVPSAHAEFMTEAERANQGIPHRQPAAGAAPQAHPVARAPMLPEPVEVQARSVTLLEAPPGPPINGRETMMALLTFAAGLGAGALVAARSVSDKARQAGRAARLRPRSR